MLFFPTHARQFIPATQRILQHLAILTVLMAAGCADTSYRFERIDGVEPVSTPLKLIGVYGVRDGASVRAELRFAAGTDSARINIVVELVPPAEFRSGSYELAMDGKIIRGTVDCTSLNYLGGQNAQPSIGGVFVLKNPQNTPFYRVRVPATVITRK